MNVANLIVAKTIASKHWLIIADICDTAVYDTPALTGCLYSWLILFVIVCSDLSSDCRK